MAESKGFKKLKRTYQPKTQTLKAQMTPRLGQTVKPTNPFERMRRLRSTYNTEGSYRHGRTVVRSSYPRMSYGDSNA